MKLVIVGGGTAGWISALILSTFQKGNHDITLIASEEIGIIGVGESTTAYFSSLVAGNFFGIDRYEFFKETGSTLKLAVKLKNWNKSKKDFYSPIDGSFTKTKEVDYSIVHSILSEDSIHNTSKCSYLCENSLTDVRKISTPSQFICDNVHAVHIDTFKTSTFLKKTCIQKGVNYINSKVINVSNDEQGNIEKVTLDSGKEIYGDFFIDASGFKRVLSSKVGAEFISYKHNLPVNKAISFVVERDEEKDFKAETISTAMNSGWMWNIPTRNRNGIGYVFSDEYITENEALQELEKHGHKPENYKLLEFESGRLKNVWNKNCISVGLSGSFLEPLQATSIHTTIAQLLIFAEKYLTSRKESLYSDIFRKKYNLEFSRMIDDFRDLVSLHYSGEKQDTPFWEDMKRENRITEFAKDIIELAQHRVLFPTDFHSYFGAAGYDIWYYILCGLGHIKKENISKFYLGFDVNGESKKHYDFHLEQMNKMKHLYFTNKELNYFFSKE